MRRSRRPNLRGTRQPAASACREPAAIFGVDGAAGLYRRVMLDDVAVAGEVFDEDFAIYREDVDLAWRAQILGWESHFAPAAVAYHVRGFHIGQDRGSSPTSSKSSLG
jgi:GT2 family glycosyltransferase